MDSEEREQSSRRRRRRQAPQVQSGGKPGLMRVLLADLRNERIASEPDELDLARMEYQEELKREESARTGRVHSLGAEHMERLRRRYSQSV